MTLVVRGKTFQRSESKDGLRYTGQFTEHVSGWVVQQKTGEWTPALIVRNPFQNKTYLDPVDGSDSSTPADALERAFDAAETIERRYAQVQRERKSRAPSRYDGFTPYEAKVEAEYEALVRRDRWRLAFRLLFGVAILTAIGWLVFYR